MASWEKVDTSRIFKFELDLREKVTELQCKSKALEKIERELCETRRNLYQTRSQLEAEQRSSNQLEIRLKSALIAVKRLEEENTKTRTEKVHTIMQYDYSSIERDALMNQARIARFENMDLKMKIQESHRNLLTAKKINKTLEDSLMEFKNSLTRLHDKLDSNLQKLEREQNQLKKTFRESTEFGQRVQTIINNCYNTTRKQRKDKATTLEQRLEERPVSIDESQKEPVRRPVPGTASSHTVDADILDLHKKLEKTLEELRSKLGNHDIEDKLALVCIELQRMDGNFVKNLASCKKWENQSETNAMSEGRKEGRNGEKLVHT
ncbi:structural maintenance of chromosomes protein 4-like [Venturia canescens]|uniref:structural maintenance of chromosomes protein 4-like n=1 Tax=Venturia canescens TaxID=32260 RepID=UPI001C9D33BB|nr:structural maintenance of chromosomes protein 4-like [Venturia canescens]